MIDFDYQAPRTVAEAVTLLSSGNGDAKLLCGGTDILVQLREGLRQAKLVIDVKKIPELMRLENSPKTGLILGAAVPCYRIYGDATIADGYAGLADSARIIGGWQIQSRASIGGNVCNGSPAADSIPVLIAYNAVCKIVGPGGERKVPIAEFFTGPGKTVLGRGEILVALELPPQPAKSGGRYLRFIPRNEMDIAVVGVGAWVQLDAAGKTIVAGRIGLGAVAPTPLFAQEATQFLAGKPTSEETFKQAGELAKKIAKPISDMRAPAEYRTHLVGVFVARALAGACERANGKTPSFLQPHEEVKSKK